MFDAPEFYELGPVAKFYGHTIDVVVTSDGERHAVYNGKTLRHALGFRAEFPDGDLPESDIEWIRNGWFSVHYEVVEDGKVVWDTIDDSEFYSFEEACKYAISASREGRGYA